MHLEMLQDNSKFNYSTIQNYLFASLRLREIIQSFKTYSLRPSEIIQNSIIQPFKITSFPP
jgi:hypothetical protein